MAAPFAFERYYARMKTRMMNGWVIGFVAVAVLGSAGCNRQTRGSADTDDRSRAMTPAEGGATSTAGSAGQSKDFGDTRAKKEFDASTPTGKSTTGGGSTGGPGAREKKDVTIQPGGSEPSR